MLPRRSRDLKLCPGDPDITLARGPKYVRIAKPGEGYAGWAESVLGGGLIGGTLMSRRLMIVCVVMGFLSGLIPDTLISRLLMISFLLIIFITSWIRGLPPARSFDGSASDRGAAGPGPGGSGRGAGGISRSHQRAIALLLLFCGSAWLIYEGIQGYVLVGTGMPASRGWPMHYLGIFFAALGILALCGVNIWKGGVLDPLNDPPAPAEPPRPVTPRPVQVEPAPVPVEPPQDDHQHDRHDAGADPGG
jgi:hypothetical protein